MSRVRCCPLSCSGSTDLPRHPSLDLRDRDGDSKGEESKQKQEVVAAKEKDEWCEMKQRSGE